MSPSLIVLGVNSRVLAFLDIEPALKWVDVIPAIDEEELREQVGGIVSPRNELTATDLMYGPGPNRRVWAVIGWQDVTGCVVVLRWSARGLAIVRRVARVEPSGYERLAWATFVGALAGVAGALTGLPSVALCVKSTALFESRALSSRAAQMLVLFMTSEVIGWSWWPLIHHGCRR
jgi:hypothetical protein